MSYCRYCGTEINYTRTANNKWLPYDVTGNPHFCNKDGYKKNNGLFVCSKCGKPVFKYGKIYMDYSTLKKHLCKKGDITRYQKYKNERIRKQK